MQRSTTEKTYQEGTVVVGADGETVGEVVAIHDTYVVVGDQISSTNGTAHVLPIRIFGRVDSDRVYLSETKSQVLAQEFFRVCSHLNGHGEGK